MTRPHLKEALAVDWRVKGLDSINHIGTLTLEIDTIYNSGGNIPEIFLRSCGAPETFIAFAKSLVRKVI